MSPLRACALVLTGLVAVGMRQPRAASPAVEDPAGLAAIWNLADGVVRDTNGDAIADAVAARVIVPSAPTVREIQAASNLAGRLAFETTALSLPIVVRDSAPPPSGALPVFLGTTNAFVARLASEGAIDLKSLTKGQGLVTVVRSPLGAGRALVVAGPDDEGTLAAANVLAARLPRLWNMSGISLPGIEEQVAGYLQSRRVEAGRPSLTSLVVDSDRRGIASVHVRVPVNAGAAGPGAAAIDELDAAHRRGQEPRTLNFSEAAAIVVEWQTDGRITGRSIVRRAGLNSRTLTPPIEPGELAPDSPGDRGRAAETSRAPGRAFDLSDAYSINGWFGDAYADLIPDRTDTALVIGGADDAIGAAHLAARLGLESTGLTLPIAKADREVEDPARETSPILVGRDNALTAELVKIGRARLDDLRPGEGAVQVVPRAFGNVTATVVAGADATGTEAAALHLARRAPYVWENRRGALSFADVEDEVKGFFRGITGAGQAGQAIRQLDDILDDLRDKTIESFEARLFLENADPALEKYLAGYIQQRVKVPAKVTTQAMTAPVPVIDETFDVPWEVEELRTKIREQVLPKIVQGAKVALEARVSESPKVRATLASEIKAELVNAGAADARVDVLSAYKQGFLWLTEKVVPALKGRAVRSVHIDVAEHKPDFSKKYKFYEVPSRWLHELYPVDELVERELGVPKDRFSLALTDNPPDIYTVEARDASDRVIERFTFSPKFEEREYLDKFPGWSRVHVTTGWLSASVNGETVADVRIKTDPERFWDHYQSSVLPKIHDHVMKVTENRPMPDKQPFHRDLDVEVWMSEPDFPIGVDEELVSSLESLHEDLYFVTLDFFDALGRTTTRRRLAGPGKIFPIIHPDQPGKPGKVRVLYAGNASTKARLEVSYGEKGATGKPTRVTRDLGAIDVSAPSMVRVVARMDRVTELELQVEAKDDASALRAADALDGLVQLQKAGLFRTALSYASVDRVAVGILLDRARTRRTVPHTGASRPSNVRPAGARPTLPLVTWDHVISPEESEEHIGRLAAFPAVAAYKAGRSYRGRDISVLEITLPTASEQVSLGKMTALKPTIFITGRQHANEVSSTSHILRLAELIATDPEYAEILKRVNFVLHPVENPDGAAMAYELQKLTPTHMLHAGRYSALGMDVASQVGNPEPLLPESRVRMRLWSEWLPDIYLNPHGYPSHEWVQQFAGYVPPGFRSYWSSRGWYTSVRGLRDPRYPGHVDATAALRDAIAREINSHPEVREMNLRHQARYQRWAYGFAPYVYPQEIYRETAIYYTDPESGEVRGTRRAGEGRGGGGGGGGRASMGAWPQVTFVSGGTEAPDETAQGKWLDLVTKPGFSYLMAHVNYLRHGRFGVELIEEDGQRDSTSRTWLRVRPVLPTGKDTTNTAESGIGK
jgi:hypothetical protein